MFFLPNMACLLCQQYSSTVICQFCKNDTVFFRHPAKPDNLLLRPDIARQLRHTRYQVLRACGEYNWPFTQLIQQLKFRRNSLPAKVLAHWFCEFSVSDREPLPQLLLPVPIPLSRYLVRRYNQSIELASHIAKILNVRVDTDWAVRKGGQRQQLLSRSQRLINLRHAYNVRLTAQVKHVAIVDDVITTGCTADVLARQLKQQHPHLHIEVWAMAVTPPPGKRRY